MKLCTYNANHGEHEFDPKTGKKDYADQDVCPMIVTAERLDEKTGATFVSGYIFPVDGSGPEFVEDVPPAGNMTVHKEGSPGWTP